MLCDIRETIWGGVLDEPFPPCDRCWLHSAPSWQLIAGSFMCIILRSNTPNVKSCLHVFIKNDAVVYCV